MVFTNLEIFVTDEDPFFEVETSHCNLPSPCYVIAHQHPHSIYTVTLSTCFVNGSRLHRTPTVAPEIVQALSPVIVSEGSTAVLFCKARAYPKAGIVWRKNGEPLPRNGRFIVSRDSYQLRILDAEMRDTGVYTCKATNALGSDEATIVVEVRGQLSPWLVYKFGLYIPPTYIVLLPVKTVVLQDLYVITYIHAIYVLCTVCEVCIILV